MFKNGRAKLGFSKRHKRQPVSVWIYVAKSSCPQSIAFLPLFVDALPSKQQLQRKYKRSVIIVMLIKSWRIHVKLKEFHSLFVWLEYLPSAILQKFSTGGIKNRTRDKKLLGVSWPSLVFRPCNLTVMGSQYFKGLETGKCLAFCDFFYTWQSCCIVALIFLSLLNSYLFFKMSVHPGQRASIDLRLNDVRQLRLILSSYF